MARAAVHVVCAVFAACFFRGVSIRIEPFGGGPCLWHNEGHGARCPSSHGSSGAVLLAISGVRNRMLFNTTVERVVKPLVQEGLPVHVYISLVDVQEKHPYLKVRKKERALATAGLTPAQLQEHFSSLVAEAGGCLVCFSLSSRSESLPEIPQKFPWSHRMTEYPPHKSSVGRNVLRLWKSREQLWEYGVEAERQLGVHYSLAMWARDDAHWVGDIASASALLASPGASKTVWTKGCKEYFGINDKVALMGREAADVMLRAWSTFMKPSPSLKSQNAETYLMRVAQAKGLSLKKLQQTDLPSGDAMFLGGDAPICFVRKYWCGEDNARFCEDL